MILLGCDKEEGWNCTKKSGDNVLDIRETGSFESVKASGKMNVTYRYAATEYVEIWFGKNVVGDITTKVENGRLYIENQTTCNWVRNLSKTPEVTIYAPSLTFFENKIAGDIHFADTLKSPSFHYDQWDANGVIDLLVEAEELNVFAHTGYAEIDVRGTAFTAQLYSGSVSIFNATELITTNVLVNNSSTYDITCHAGNYLYGAINSSGNIRYLGSPDLVDTRHPRQWCNSAVLKAIILQTIYRCVPL